MTRAAFPPDDEGLRAFRELAATNITALNHAVRDIPAERIRCMCAWAKLGSLVEGAAIASGRG